MRWQMGRRSANVEDRRGLPVGRAAIGGGGAILILIVAMLLGADPRDLLDQLGAAGDAPGELVQQSAAPVSAQDTLAEFVSVVLAETEDVWHAQFRRLGREYREPTLVLFTGRVESACGLASAAVGPFYCPGDAKLYIDLAFYDDLRRRFHAPGDFAQAYVIAHEVGHHVQNLLGITSRMDEARGQVSEAEFNALSVRLELQADFLAGVWAHYAQRTKDLLEPGDIEEALGAATAIGDDRLQMEARGHIVPDSFTHGTSAQRVRWFRRGYETGDLEQGDTFSAETL
jgi:uncharacterized protein